MFSAIHDPDVSDDTPLEEQHRTEYRNGNPRPAPQVASRRRRASRARTRRGGPGVGGPRLNRTINSRARTARVDLRAGDPLRSDRSPPPTALR